jgi:predicted Fe-Mo cluster-binding NifX family protein
MFNSYQGVFILKIAVVTDDGITICQHFGRALYYLVITSDKGKVINTETREKAGHHSAAGPGCHEGHDCHDGQHGMDAVSQNKHAGMLANILDCQVLIAGGMGYGAYESLKSAGLEPIITDANTIEGAVNSYLQGKLVNLMEKLH